MTATVTIGSFTCSTLTAQPYNYDGDARNGLTARAFRISGLLTSTQWSTLLTTYNTWKASRLNDEDTLASEAVGTTVSLTISTNGISISGLACWFADAPSGDQVGPYISANAVLIDAAEAVASIVRERERNDERAIADAGRVNCDVITARLEQRRDEAACELTALEDGIADDFATQAINRELINKTADLAARTGQAEALASLDVALEKLNKQATLAAKATEANDLALLDLQQQLQDTLAQVAAYDDDAAEDLAGATLDLEIAKASVDNAAKASRLETLRTSRSLTALYDRYISEDLPDLGNITLGSVTIKLTKPADTRADGPNVSLTAGGVSYITGARTAHAARQIDGIITSGSYSSLLSWYDSTVAGAAGAGTWFPTSPPTATAEPFLISGVKATRYSVSVSVVQLK